MSCLAWTNLIPVWRLATTEAKEKEQYSEKLSCHQEHNGGRNRGDRECSNEREPSHWAMPGLR